MVRYLGKYRCAVFKILLPTVFKTNENPVNPTLLKMNKCFLRSNSLKKTLKRQIISYIYATNERKQSTVSRWNY